MHKENGENFKKNYVRIVVKVFVNDVKEDKHFNTLHFKKKPSKSI